MTRKTDSESRNLNLKNHVNESELHGPVTANRLSSFWGRNVLSGWRTTWLLFSLLLGDDISLRCYSAEVRLFSALRLCFALFKIIIIIIIIIQQKVKSLILRGEEVVWKERHWRLKISRSGKKPVHWQSWGRQFFSKYVIQTIFLPSCSVLSITL